MLKERLRPDIDDRSSCAGLALLPLIIKGNVPGHEIEYPMAVVILGGLVTSTLLNLFILPAFYLRFGRGTGALTEQPDCSRSGTSLSGVSETNVSLEESAMAQDSDQILSAKQWPWPCLSIFICLGLSSGGAMAQKSKASQDALEAFDRSNFDNSAIVDNKWFPLQPGTRWSTRGSPRRKGSAFPLAWCRP